MLAARIMPVGRPFAQTATAYGAAAMPHGTVNAPSAFISIAKDGTVTIVCHRSEMGQGVRTGMPQIVADELEADWSRVHVVNAPGDEEKYGNQDTDGSRSTRHFMQPMREAGAAARMMLEQTAAKRWGVDPSEVEARNHEVIHKASGRKLGYGELAEEAATLEVPANDQLKLKSPDQFRYIGKALPLADGFDITVGKAQYGFDTWMEGMKYAVVARPPVFGGKVVVVRRFRSQEDPRRREDREDRGHPGPRQVHAAGRRRRHREQYLGGDEGPRRRNRSGGYGCTRRRMELWNRRRGPARHANDPRRHPSRARCAHPAAGLGSEPSRHQPGGHRGIRQPGQRCDNHQPEHCGPPGLCRHSLPG